MKSTFDTQAPGLQHISTYLPERVLDNAECISRFDFDQSFLTDKLGIETRHIAAENESVADMAVAAGEKLFAEIDLDKNTIDLIIIVTQNPDYKLPTTANIVQERLGLSQSVAAFDVNQGCSGYIYGLSLITAMMQTHRFNNALLITSEAYSKLMDPIDRSTVPLFGDGATASLITSNGTGKIGEFSFGSDGGGANELIVRAGGSRFPNKTLKGEDALSMNGRAIFNFMMRQVPQDIKRCLSKNNLTDADIDLYLFHQASRYMVETLAKSMSLPAGKVPINLSETGNTVSNTIPMLIDTLGGLEALKNKRVLVSGFGVGLSWASTILTFEGKKPA